MTPYVTVIIPPVSLRFRTPWHADDNLTTLSRGVFATEDKAILWAMQNLAGTPYSLRWIREPVSCSRCTNDAEPGNTVCAACAMDDEQARKG
jgi:hypothetical protein